MIQSSYLRPFIHKSETLNENLSIENLSFSFQTNSNSIKKKIYSNKERNESLVNESWIHIFFHLKIAVDKEVVEV